MSKFRDLVGKRFGDLIVIEFVALNNQKRAIWKCRCESCGTIKAVRSDALISGRSKTCGCRHTDLTGRRFGRLMVTSISGSSKYKRRVWSCECECGNIIEASSGYLLNGETKSCGCLVHSGDHRVTHGARREQKRERATFGPASKGGHHSMRAKAYTAWVNMKARCYNEGYRGYSSYGGRGITVCDGWKDSFEKFLADVGEPPRPDLTLERLDPNGNYEPSNVAWASELVQRLNKQDTQPQFIDLKETLRELCRRSEISFDKLFEAFLVGDPMRSFL